jgi:chromosome segregation ATPase
MSKLSKVFVVFVFVLSVAFFGTSATLFKTRQDWKSAYLSIKKDMQEQLNSLKQRNDELGKTNDAQHNTITEIKSREDQLAKELKQKVEDLNEEKKKVQVATLNQSKANSTSEQLAKTVEADKASQQLLQEALTKTKSDLDTALATTLEANKRSDSMRLDLAKVQGDLHGSRTELKNLSEDYETVKLMLDALRAKHPNENPLLNAPPIDALVNAVDAKEKLVVLSAGKDQKVESGYEFTVYRGDEFIGKVQVIKVYPDLAGARILYTKEGTEIQPGDNASTKLN